jgi:hypothetical protein
MPRYFSCAQAGVTARAGHRQAADRRVLLALFLVSWLGQGISQWFEAANEARAHGEAGTLAEFLPAFLAATLENWQSEFLQLLTFVVLTSFLVHKGSHESKDSDEQMRQALRRIERRLERFEPGHVQPNGANGAATSDGARAGRTATPRP